MLLNFINNTWNSATVYKINLFIRIFNSKLYLNDNSLSKYKCFTYNKHQTIHNISIMDAIYFHRYFIVSKYHYVFEYISIKISRLISQFPQKFYCRILQYLQWLLHSKVKVPGYKQVK
ncbi:uncharacterized protein VICG_00894 [Vittaforma corneae ATCC 50505]|uniref:Uncharacterized protein n=1 Tax=Vittaforma corneae (strain ATCC 50505) TaxID=993615 RepID=L2GNH3_VITCO|nr:uncharacterized protein VICG_00894 [Vittaforma corneae ATCC 50505]ELA42045.1 hypothetical protein VICG_00894 [Vittaforma corneae ATCC 50505]